MVKYSDPNKRYVVFTDASDQAAAATLTQEYPDSDGKITELAAAYLSAQFSDTQFKWSRVVKEGFIIYYCITKWTAYLEDAEILLKSDAKSLEKFLLGRTNNLKLDRWSLELQGKRIQCEHIPGAQNKAADCLSRLPSVTHKRQDSPLHDNPDSTQVHQITADDMNPECRLYEVDFTDIITLQQQDNHCIRILNLMKDKNSNFPDRDIYAVDK